MSDISVAAKCSVEDSLLKSQVIRWGSRPLVTDNKDLAKFTSFKGRGYALLEIGLSIVREPYRAFKNLLIIAERIYNLVRSFFEALFREPQTTWRQTGRRAKELLSSIVALFVRPLTFVLDILRLGAGLFAPAAAIKVNKTEGDDDHDNDGIEDQAQTGEREEDIHQEAINE